MFKHFDFKSRLNENNANFAAIIINSKTKRKWHT